MNKFELVLADEDATVGAGATLSELLTEGAVMYLHGDLGAGKTTFSRGVIQGLGHAGNVKSPTYTLVEPYQLSDVNAYHFDLYRLADPEELEFMGVRDYFAETAVCIVEWPERGEGLLPVADIEVFLSYYEQQRKLKIIANNEKGLQILAQLKHKMSGQN